MTTVIHHSADMDGIFCREIARKFLPDATLIGWDFADKPMTVPQGSIYVLDLPVDRVFGWKFEAERPERTGLQAPFQFFNRVVWIDHHASSLASHPNDIPGYRIDGVAACRLAWQWFTNTMKDDFGNLPSKQAFVERMVTEPRAVRLAGEYDIWDKRDEHADILQYGLRSRKLAQADWDDLLAGPMQETRGVIQELLRSGTLLQTYQQRNDAGMMHRSFLLDWEGLKFLALTTARCNSLTFASKDVPETGHDALMGFYFNGDKWTFSLYHAKHRTDLDLSKIAVKHGGGGHCGACGFVAKSLPFAASLNKQVDAITAA